METPFNKDYINLFGFIGSYLYILIGVMFVTVMVYCNLKTQYLLTANFVQWKGNPQGVICKVTNICCLGVKWALILFKDD